MDSGEVEQVREEVDALCRGLSEERFRHVAGITAQPGISAVFEAHGLAAHRDTVAMLREEGERDLAARVAGLVAERAPPSSRTRRMSIPSPSNPSSATWERGAGRNRPS
jgi:hypothetical protein